MEIKYDLMEKEIFNLLGDKKIMVLATSSNQRVTARNMSCIVMNKKIYFQTDKTFLKYQQIIQNPNIALCIENIQIEGVANIKKHPFDEENKEFKTNFEKHFKSSYNTYSRMKNEIVIEVQPVFITLWKYVKEQPSRNFLDIKNKKAYRESYNTKL